MSDQQAPSKMVERVAKAILGAIDASTHNFGPGGTATTMEEAAKSAMVTYHNALNEAGYRIVPVVPTEAMVNAAPEWRDVDFYPSDVWQAMVEAAGR